MNQVELQSDRTRTFLNFAEKFIRVFGAKNQLSGLGSLAPHHLSILISHDNQYNS
ncbi:hypothetical protein [Altericista sp. CCNU0014]|uniref:hypothetical protein n=1 Tax=Altericista sp. CCNU0014 TaxID=3082949 RepID=UPI00384AA23C